MQAFVEASRGIWLPSGSAFDIRNWDPAPTSVKIAACLIPYIIAYLVFVPNTRTLRVALLPVGILCATRVCLGAALGAWRPGDPLSNQRGVAGITATNIVLYSIVFHLGACTRYAFWTAPPTFHEPSRKPFFFGIRKYTAFKALHMLLDEERKLTYSTSPKQPRGRPYLRSLAYHSSRLIWYFILLDVFTYPAYRTDPEGCGSPCFLGGDYYAWQARLARDWGQPEIVIRAFITLCLAGATFVGISVTWHMVCLIYVASGLWADEECPRLTNYPWLSTSLIELWSRRWHQLHKQLFLYFSAPLARLGTYARLTSVFVVSGLFHATMFATMEERFNARQDLAFFGVCGLGCALERAFFAITGRRVGGWWGRIWTWSFVFWASEAFVVRVFILGWAGSMRGFYADHPEFSLVEWLVSIVGRGASTSAKHSTAT